MKKIFAALINNFKCKMNKITKIHKFSFTIQKAFLFLRKH
jgi:hypothetical protein